ncbi:MAG: chloride channel protein family [Acidimicrobiaceae bacterium]|nr:chloride channel protein family [Acidimicrobiaceae bacterium]MDQ1399599.1 chloride channel protein family [Acidimicrobiaceae bacterium]MDQ1413319.1 chloride channel protein family [Acidimicrobiaceae bacterium]MDQ1418041.1 chloride channel protein family [Acidimicrobiaceae bacterium]MDQ1442299.1 chloride channel protein family [Acidimicrobiaceae bacterium]
MTDDEQPAGQPSEKRPIWVLLTPAGRSPRVLLLAALTGLLTGAAVAAFDQTTGTVLLGRIQRAPLAVQALGPLCGLLLAAAVLKWVGGGASPATADDYVRNFHTHDQRLSLRAAPAKVLAAVATLGAGTPLGYEGPSIYMGAIIGSGLQRRMSSVFSRRDAKVLLVAGAAAGVAAIFKAPATGAIFALEVPYQDDLARNMLLPALVGAAMGYVTFAALVTTTSPLLAIKGAPPFDLRDLGGALVIGILAGIGARAFAALIRAAKRLSARLNPFVGAAGAGIILGALIVAGRAISDQPLAIGPGYQAIRWATDPTHGVLLVAGLLLIRTLAVPVALAGGGVGGLFIPLVVEGALVGRLCGSAFGQPGSSLFPVIGIAAFLGAGYRVPLAALMFVAESTGRPEFVVPGLIAAVAAQLLMGRASVSAYQQARQAGHLERRFQLPLADVVRTDIATLAPTATVADLFNHLRVGPRRSSVAVVDQGRYVGMARLDDMQDLAQDQWADTTVAEIMRTDVAAASPSWTFRQALAAMERADVDELAVVDGDRLTGIVSSSDILRLHDLFEQATEDGRDLGV